MFHDTRSISKTVVPKSPESQPVVCFAPLGKAHTAGRFQAVSESATSLHERFSWCSLPYSRHKNKHYIQEAERALFGNRGLYFAILDKHTGRFLGEAAIDHIAPDNSRLNMIYWIRTSERGKGYATAAVRLLLRFIEEHIPVRQAEMVMETNNAGSRRVAQKAGARYSHTQPNGALHKPFQADTYCFIYPFYKNIQP